MKSTIKILGGLFLAASITPAAMAQSLPAIPSAQPIVASVLGAGAPLTAAVGGLGGPAFQVLGIGTQLAAPLLNATPSLPSLPSAGDLFPLNTALPGLALPGLGLPQ